ncbi:MAG: glycosyltransferase [Chitinophagaceae bacterium]|nr:glycosyltransferase [Anaerolineae bacterium]
MSNAPKTPIDLIAYKRHQHLRRALDSLSRCRRLDECQLYIYCDGAKKLEHLGSVQATKQVAREWTAQLGAILIERDQNMGLARSIVSAVSELCTQYGRVIVLEDDLVMSPDFLDHMLRGLEHYQDTPEVMQISGYMFPLDPPPLQELFLLPLTTTWGWATWAQAWQAFNWDASDSVEFFANPANRHQFDLDGAYSYTIMLEDRLAGKNDSWGILWWYRVFRDGGLVLYPRYSLVRNEGFDGSGTHWNIPSTEQNGMEIKTKWMPIATNTSLPDVNAVDTPTFERIKTHLRPPQIMQIQRESGSLLHRARAKIGQLLKNTGAL